MLGRGAINIICIFSLVMDESSGFESFDLLLRIL